MNVSRNFLLFGVAWLLFGMGLGEYMAATQDHAMLPVHAHVNLVGFVLSSVFALTYRAYPAMAASRLSTVHFWLHVVAGSVLVVMLFLLFSGRIDEAAMVPLAPIAGTTLMVGVALFGWNVLANAR